MHTLVYMHSIYDHRGAAMKQGAAESQVSQEEVFRSIRIWKRFYRMMAGIPSLFETNFLLLVDTIAKQVQYCYIIWLKNKH